MAELGQRLEVIVSMSDTHHHAIESTASAASQLTANAHSLAEAVGHFASDPDQLCCGGATVAWWPATSNSACHTGKVHKQPGDASHASGLKRPALKATPASVLVRMVFLRPTGLCR